jgi:UDP-N-acetylglucosamine pyrophosphorylase
VLKSDRAEKVSFIIIDVFVKLREMLLDNNDLRFAFEEIKKKTENNTKNIELVFQYLDELLEKKSQPKPRKQIGYKIPKNKNK